MESWRRHRLGYGRGSPWSNAGSGGGVSAGTGSWLPTNMANLELWVHAQATPHLWVEGNDQTAYQNVSASAQLVGQVDDPSPAAHSVWASTTTRRPVMENTGSEWHLHFTSANKQFTVKNSLQAFNFFHTAGSGSVLFKVRSELDGTAQQWLDSSAGSTSNHGVYLNKTANDQLQWIVFPGKAGQVVSNFTTVGTIKAAQGFIDVIINMSGTHGTIQVGPSGTEDFAVTSANFSSATGSANSDLFIGTNNANGVGAEFSVQAMAILSNTASAGDIASWRTYTASLGAGDLIRSASSGYFNFLQDWWHFGDTTTLFQDTAAATPVAANGDPIGLVKHKLDPMMRMRRDLQVTGSNSFRPPYSSSLAAVSFNGTGSSYEFNLQYPTSTGPYYAWPPGGAQTVFIVARQQHNTFNNGVSDLMDGGAFLPLYGPGANESINGRTSPPSPAGPYFGVHGAGGGTVQCTLYQTGVNAWNILEIRRSSGYTNGVAPVTGTYWEHRASGWSQSDGNGLFTVAGSTNPVTASNYTGSWKPATIGPDNGEGGGGADWLQGDIRQVLVFNAHLSTAQCNLVVKALSSSYGDFSTAV